MHILDTTTNRWMARWDHPFNVFIIASLRSRMFLSIDARDRDGLLAFAYGQGTANDLQEIYGCVGKEVSKHRRRRRMTRI